MNSKDETKLYLQKHVFAGCMDVLASKAQHMPSFILPPHQTVLNSVVMSVTAAKHGVAPIE